jgi:hypothetical protein
MGTVISIDSASTCTVQPLDITRTPVSNILLTSDDTASPSFVPAVGSRVTVNIFSSNSGYIAQNGSVSKTSISTGTINYGGIVIVQSVVNKLNAIENLLNDLISKHNTHIHPAVDSITTALITISPTATLETTLIAPITVVSDLENTAATHGNGVSDNTAYIAQLKVLSDQADVLAATVAHLQTIYPNPDIAQKIQIDDAILQFNNKFADYNELVQKGHL